MSVRLVNPDGLPDPSGYAHAAVGRGRPVLLAGQVGCGPSGRIDVADGLVAQFGKALDNLLVALRAAGGDVEDVAYLRIFTTDVPGYRAHLKELGQAYRARLGRHYPAMALVGVAELFEPGALLEIEGVAYVD